ncbi:hypothetical protein MTO96_025262 [Rhipicephalus appendiculatus]
MTLVYVICDNHFDLGIVAIKSAVAYSTTRLHLIIIADTRNKERLRREYSSWPDSIKKRVSFDVMSVWFPKEKYNEWWAMFKPCATQRLFLTSMLPNVDAVLYVDTDVIFVHPVEDFWRMFFAMNEWQMAGMAPETEDFNMSHYLKNALHPFVQPFALNAGLLMMNLTRMRAFDLESWVMRLKEEFEGRIPYADQDLLNIVFARYPQGIFTFTCRWNFRGEHCSGGALCTDGPIAVVHASRRMLRDNPEPGFITLHRAMRNHRLRNTMANVSRRHLFVALCVLAVCGCLLVTRMGYVQVKVNWPEFDDVAEQRAEESPAFSTVVLKRPPVSEKMTLVYAICENHFNIGSVAINVKERVSCDVMPVWFPKEDYHQWWAMFRPCTTQRLFLTRILPNEDAVLYVDTDVIFVHPIEDLWRKFYAMNEWQMAGMAPETESYKHNVYIKEARHPFFQPFALNAGLLMMNLTRLRAFDLEKRVKRAKQEFEGRVPPIAAVHASRKMLLDYPEPAFVTLHRTMRNFKLGQKLVDDFIDPLKKNLQKTTVTGCTKELKKQLHQLRLSASRVDKIAAQASTTNKT